MGARAALLSTLQPPFEELTPETAWKPIAKLWEDLLASMPFVVIGLLVFVLFLFGARLIRRALVAAGRRTNRDPALVVLVGRLGHFFTVLLGALVAAVVVFPRFTPANLIAGLGITSVAIGFAFKDILQNFFAGVLILWRRPFRVGDQIRTRDYEGTVEEINVRSTRLHTYDGERAILPNGEVYANAILVRTAYDRRRVRFSVGIAYEASIEEARTAIHGALAEIEGVLPDPAPWVYVSELGASAVILAVYFWVAPDQANVLRVGDRAATAIKGALDAKDIEIPYPHTVVLVRGETPQRGEA